MVGFGTAIANGWRNYVNFTGRSTRAEFWWWTLFTFIVSFVLGYVDSALGLVYGNPGPTGLGQTSLLSSLFSLAVFLPSLAVYVRRIRDAGFHWAWVFTILVPVLGFVLLIVFGCSSTRNTHNNQHAQPTYTSDNGLVGY